MTYWTMVIVSGVTQNCMVTKGYRKGVYRRVTEGTWREAFPQMCTGWRAGGAGCPISRAFCEEWGLSTSLYNTFLD